MTDDRRDSSPLAGLTAATRFCGRARTLPRHTLPLAGDGASLVQCDITAVIEPTP